MLVPPDRVAFYLGNYPVMKYGITLGIAIFICIFVLLAVRQKFYDEFSEDTVLDLSFYIILGGILGARLWYVLLNINYYIAHIGEIIMVNHGGISIHGAIFGGITAGFVYVKYNNLNFLRLADMYSLVIPIGQAVGRWGNFFNSEAFGKPCELFWKMYIAPQYRPLEYKNVQYFHPTFLYESIANVMIFIILFVFLRNKFKDYDGMLFFSYLIMYSFIRIFIEFIRIDSVLNIGNIPVAAVVSAVIIVVSFLSIIYLYKIKGFN